VRIELRSSLREVTADDVRDRHVVVIDVLRASSTMVHAWSQGAARIVPVATVADAWRTLEGLDRASALLGGERDGLAIEGFDLGNSPFEYSRETVAGKTLVLTTSNGTLALSRCGEARHVVVGCFLNMAAVVAHLARQPAADVLVLCAGHLGDRCEEDYGCGALFVERLARLEPQNATLETDATAARAHAAGLTDIHRLLRQASHGRRLASLGFERDLEFCARLDTHAVVPVYAGGAIERRGDPP